MLACQACGRENPDDNRFCGRCGAALTPPRPEEPRRLSGPSFLGLSDEPASFSYDEEEDEAIEGSSWRAWVVLAVLLIVGGLVWLQWRHLTTLRSEPQESRPSAMQTEQTEKDADTDKQATGEPSAGPSAGPEQPAEGKAAPENEAATEEKPAKSTQGEDTPHRDEDTKQPADTSGEDVKQEAPAEESEEELADKLERERQAQGGGEHEPASRAAPQTDADLAIARRALAAGDKDEAVRRLWASTSKGSAVAPVLLAKMYLNGDGVERSCEQALVLLNSAARRQNAQARSQLGAMYANGTCVQQDRVAAYHWYTLALHAAPDNDAIQHQRARLWESMTEMEREEARALR